jgi:cell division initiation protein
MTAKRPVFRVMKNGYDRFAVDDAVEKYADEVEELEKRIALYQRQIAEDSRKMEEMNNEIVRLQNELADRKAASDEIARLSLREANEIIAAARKNADQIVQEAVNTASGILHDLARLYEEAGKAKGGMSDQLEKLQKDLDSFEVPTMPDLKWLQDALDKMQ